MIDNGIKMEKMWGEEGMENGIRVMNYGVKEEMELEVIIKNGKKRS